MAIFISGTIIFSFLNATVISLVSPIWRIKNALTMEQEAPSLLKEQTQENLLLELIGRKQKTNTTVAAVLTHPPQTPYDIIIIDAGRDESITLGSEVSLPGGPVLGTVSEVFPKAAQVRLFSAVGEETNALLERENVPVTLTGAGGGNFRLSLPRDIKVEIGDRILSLGVISHLLAIVEEVNAQPADSLKEVLAKSPVNIFTLRFVFVTP